MVGFEACMAVTTINKTSPFFALRSNDWVEAKTNRKTFTKNPECQLKDNRLQIFIFIKIVVILIILYILHKFQAIKRISADGHLQYCLQWGIPFGKNPVLEQSSIKIRAKKTSSKQIGTVITQIWNSSPGSIN